MTKLYFAIGKGLVIVTARQGHSRCNLHLMGHDIRCVSVDAFRPGLIYCGTFDSGLWCSDNAGDSWHCAGSGILYSKVHSVAVSRSERNGGRGVVYAGTEPSAIFRSEDGGETWQACGDLSLLSSFNEWSFPPRPETHHVRWIEPDPHVQGRLFAAIEAGALIRSYDRGKTWVDRAADGPRDAHQLWIHSSSPDRLYSAAGDGYFESQDGGVTWRRSEGGLRHRYVWSLAVDRGDPETIILSAASSARASHDEAAESHLYRRAGSDWQEIRSGLPAPTGRRTAVLAAHPNKAGWFYAVWENDVFYSTNGGAHWERLELDWPKGGVFNEQCALAVAEVG
jgi:hypothetical protein